MLKFRNEVRSAEMPLYCAGCNDQDSRLKYVDFDAACDRGYGDDDHIIAMEDLVLCENCVREGAKVLGYENTFDLKEELKMWKSRYEKEKQLRYTAQRYADSLEEALRQGKEYETTRKRKTA